MKDAQPTIPALADGICSGNRRALAKGITLVESSRAEDTEDAQTLVNQLLPHTGRARRIGITGVPGVGKSTFIEAFGLMLIDKGLRVAVLTIDPSSERTGGSILGDKTRMMHLARAPEAFIRPSPAGTHRGAATLGGVTRRTRETMLLCEAAGFDVVIVETVGVGQSETSVAAMVDFFLVLMLAGAGDELQGMKRGIMELADAVAITKVEDANRTAAELAGQHLRNALHLGLPKYNDWQVPVMLCSALEKRGLEEIWQVVCKFMDDNPARVQDLRRRQAVRWMRSAVDDALNMMLTRSADVRELRSTLEASVMAGAISPMLAAARLLEAFERSFGRERSRDSLSELGFLGLKD
jgi:LAO/AO transport system kinase